MAPLRFPLLFAVLACVPTAHSQNPAPELPRVGTAFVIEDGRPVQIHASEATFDRHAVDNFVRAQVFVGPTATLTIHGATSSLQLPDHSLVFYIRLGSDPDIMRKRIELLHLGVEAQTRSVVTLSRNAFGGHHKRKETAVPVSIADTDDPTLVQVKPEQPLDPGEYAFAFMPSDPGETPTVVYDFTVTSPPKK